jgi:hypothetical protein
MGKPERDKLGDLGVDERIILRQIFKEIRRQGVDWIDLAQWRTFMKAVMKLHVL